MATDPKPESLIVSVSAMRERLEEVLREVTEHGQRIVIEDGGEPQAVVIGIDDYRKILAPAPEWLQAAWREAERAGTSNISMEEIDAEIAASRRERLERDGAA